MDRQLSDGTECEETCRQCAVPITVSSLHDVSVDGPSLASLQSSLWSYSPSLSYQQVCESAWHSADNEWGPVINRQMYDESHCQHRQMNDASRYQDMDHFCYWPQPVNTAASLGDAAASARTTNNFDVVCDTALSGDMSDKLTTFNHTHRYPSPKAVTGRNPDDFVASSVTELQPKLDTVGRHISSCQATKAMPVTLDCYESGCPASRSCDKLNSASVGATTTAKSEFLAAGDMMSCRYSEEMSRVSCRLHSVRSTSSYQTEESTTECCDMHSASAAELHQRHLHPTHQQHMFANCYNTDFISHVVNSERCSGRLCSNQSASMTELDDFDLPLNNASTIKSVPAAVVGSAASATRASSSSHDIGCVTATRLNCELLDSVKIERRKDLVHDPESSWQASAKIKENRKSGLNVQNCVDDDASNLTSSLYLKPSSTSRKSKKKVERVLDEKLPQAVPDSETLVREKSVCDNDHNLAAFNGAMDDNLYTTHTTASVTVESNMPCRAGNVSINGKKSLHKQNSKSKCESLSRTPCTAAKHSEPFSTESVVHSAPFSTDSVAHSEPFGTESVEHSQLFSTDPVETDKLRGASVSHLHLESHRRLETPSGLRHHRRPVHRSSRQAPKQRSTKHCSHEKDRTPTRFHFKQFLQSIDWQQQQQNFGLFLL